MTYTILNAAGERRIVRCRPKMLVYQLLEGDMVHEGEFHTVDYDWDAKKAKFQKVTPKESYRRKGRVDVTKMKKPKLSDFPELLEAVIADLEAIGVNPVNVRRLKK